MKITKAQLKQIIKEELESVVSEGMFDPLLGKAKDMASGAFGPSTALGGDQAKQAWKEIGGSINTRDARQIEDFYNKAGIKEESLEKFIENLRYAVKIGEEDFKIYSLRDTLDAGFNNRRGMGRPKAVRRVK